MLRTQRNAVLLKNAIDKTLVLYRQHIFASSFYAKGDIYSESDDEIFDRERNQGTRQDTDSNWTNPKKWKVNNVEDTFTPKKRRSMENSGFSKRRGMDNSVLTKLYGTEISGFPKRRGFDNFSKLNTSMLWENEPPVQKNFYEEHAEIAARSKDTDLEYFKQHNIHTKGQNVLRPILNFNQVNFPDSMREVIEKQDWSEPTPTQAMGWPLALSGRDVVGISRTGSGKTAAFLFPGLIHIMNQRPTKVDDGPIMVCVVPTRELAQQVGKFARAFSSEMKKRTAIIYGGARKEPQANMLDKSPEIVVATPGRLLDFMQTGVTNMGRCTYLVLDEADRMLDMGFEPQIRNIVNQIRPDRQTLMYTATWPREVQELASKFQSDPVQVNIGTTKLHANPNIEQRIIVCPTTEKDYKLFECLNVIGEEAAKTLIFVATKRKADRLAKQMKRHGVPADAIHGDKSQTMRENILSGFKSGRVPVLIATDVASRGLDVQDISYVINVDFPKVIEDYVHRIGRTARGERSGVSISFITEEDTQMAGDLISVLHDSGQQVPEELYEVVKSNRHNRSKRGYKRY